MTSGYGASGTTASQSPKPLNLTQITEEITLSGPISAGRSRGNAITMDEQSPLEPVIR